MHRLTDNTRDVIAWCRQQGLLASERNCAACGAEMLEGADRKRSDGLRWRCRNNNCKRECSTREGSFFGNGTKLELVKIVDLLYSYSYEAASLKNLMRECRIARGLRQMA